MRDADSARPPFALKGIEHVLLLVSGMDETLAFYGDVLGAQLETRLPEYGMAELRAGDSHIDLVDIAAPEGAWAQPPVAGGRNVDHIAMKLNACDEHSLRRHLVKHGVDIVEERVNVDSQGETLSLYVRDPSGNTVELMCASS
jgi:glyoxylase I family protein